MAMKKKHITTKKGNDRCKEDMRGQQGSTQETDVHLKQSRDRAAHFQAGFCFAVSLQFEFNKARPLPKESRTAAFVSLMLRLEAAKCRTLSYGEQEKRRDQLGT